MELSSKQQIFEVIKRSKKLLLATNQNPSNDAVSALIALGLFLEKDGKNVDMVMVGSVPIVLSFLPKSDKIKKNINISKNFKISLDTSEIKVDQFSYDFDKDNKKLNIYITPESGTFTKDHISTDMLGFGYDAIMILDCSDFEKLGKLYSKNSDLFYETEVVNLDSNNANEQYGEINLINPTASSISEIVFDLLESIDEKIIDKNIATCLLTGIISATRSFQDTNATPQSFAIAAKLISYGANQQLVINNLYKNKSLATLKLWGRVLARVKYDPDTKIAWSLIAQKDFVNSGAQTKDLEGIADEIMGSVNDADISFVLYEKNEKKEIKALIKSNKNRYIGDLSKLFNTMPQQDVMKINIRGSDLLSVEKDLLAKIKNLVK